MITEDSTRWNCSCKHTHTSSKRNSKRAFRCKYTITNKRRTLSLVYKSNFIQYIHYGTISLNAIQNTMIRHLNTHRSASASEVAPAAVSLVEVKSSACKVRLTLHNSNTWWEEEKKHLNSVKTRRNKTIKTRHISGGLTSHLNAAANDATPSSIIAFQSKVNFNKVVLLLQTHSHIT